jgi:heme/copper-type cytochrome/quinol oxidase subunit 2
VLKVTALYKNERTAPTLPPRFFGARGSKWYNVAVQKRTILAFFGVLLAACVLCLAWAYANRERFFLLDPVGPVAAEEKYILLLTVLLSGLVVVPVFGMLFWFSLRYRSESEHATKKHARNWDHTYLAEIICWVVPTIIIVFLSVLAWRGSHALELPS